MRGKEAAGKERVKKKQEEKKLCEKKRTKREKADTKAQTCHVRQTMGDASEKKKAGSPPRDKKTSPMRIQ